MKKKKKITRPAGKRPETTRCDGVTTYYRKGKVCHCSSKRPPGSREERDRRRAARTLNQRQRSSVFALVSRLVKILTRKLRDLNAWVSLAKATNMTPANLCHKVNGTACDENGVANFRAFIFSVGGSPCRSSPASPVAAGRSPSSGDPTASPTRRGTRIRLSSATSTIPCPTRPACFTCPTSPVPDG